MGCHGDLRSMYDATVLSAAVLDYGEHDDATREEEERERGGREGIAGRDGRTRTDADGGKIAVRAAAFGVSYGPVSLHSAEKGNIYTP